MVYSLFSLFVMCSGRVLCDVRVCACVRIVASRYTNFSLKLILFLFYVITLCIFLQYFLFFFLYTYKLFQHFFTICIQLMHFCLLGHPSIYNIFATQHFAYLFNFCSSSSFLCLLRRDRCNRLKPQKITDVPGMLLEFRICSGFLFLPFYCNLFFFLLTK